MSLINTQTGETVTDGEAESLTADGVPVAIADAPVPFQTIVNALAYPSVYPNTDVSGATDDHREAALEQYPDRSEVIGG